jgi:hypothetical protein
MEAEDDFGAWRPFDAEAVGADGDPAVGPDLDRRAHAPNIRPPRAARGWAQHGALFLFGQFPSALRGHAQYGRVNSEEELEAKRLELSVPVQNAIIDSGYKAREVYRFCLKYGWKAFKGDDAEFFMHTVRKGNVTKTVRHIWKRNLVDPHYGTNLQGRTRPIPLFTWSNSAVKEEMAEQMTGKAGEWTLPRRVEALYLKQVTAQRRESKTDTKGRVSYFWKQTRRDNHLGDCEEMIHVAAVITKVIRAKAFIIAKDN